MMSSISCFKRLSILTRSQFLYNSISLNIFSLHYSDSGILLYFIFCFTSYDVKFSFSILHKLAIEDMFLPQTVLLSFWTILTNKHIPGLLHLFRVLMNLTNLAQIITFGCMHWEMVSFKYLCVLLGTEKVFLTQILYEWYSHTICMTVSFPSPRRRPSPLTMRTRLLTFQLLCLLLQTDICIYRAPMESI